MTRAYTEQRRDLTVAALVRDGADELRHAPGMRNVGLGARTAIVKAAIGALLSVERDAEGTK